MNYADFKNSEFFNFFNLRTESSKELSSGIIELHLKTGGFQEYIDIYFYLDKKSEIKKAKLLSDREWIGDPSSINPFGTDISKSFIDIVFPKHLTPEFKKHLIHYLFNLRGDNQVLIPLHKAFQGFENAAPEVIDFLDVYRGQKEHVVKTHQKYTLTMQNIYSEGKGRLLIEMTYKPKVL